MRAESMKARCVEFIASRTVEIRTKDVALHGEGLLCRSLLMGLSAGSELLAYRGSMPSLNTDTLKGLAEELRYPFAYGYINLAEVMDDTDTVDSPAAGSRVFAFYPHQEMFRIHPRQCIPVPADISTDNAVFLASMETAVSIVHDTHPRLGERVAVLGQGVIGLLTAILLRKNGAQVTAVEPDLMRRSFSRGEGIHAVHPDDFSAGMPDAGQADAVVDTAGSPSALAAALPFCRHEGRVVVASWYGDTLVSLPLGHEFHRRRLRMVSSQVSHVGAEASGSWSKQRRFELVWDLIRELNPARFITHRFDMEDCAAAFKLADEHTEPVLQIVLSP
ncbi:MAG: zinc-dependent alcohol dehydrogenase [Spirochaeta sp.]